MKIRLSHIEHAPKALPIWQAILDDLGDPSARRVARALGVSVRTVYRWNAAQEAPRCAVLALFWLTRWGRSQVDAQAANDAAMACSYVETLTREVERLEIELRHVHALNASGAANQPLMRLPT